MPLSSDHHLSAKKLAILERLRQHAGSAEPRIPRLSGPDVASHAQRQFWVLEQAFGRGPYAYNHSTSLSLTGPLDVGALQAALDEVVRRHAALRTNFEMKNGTLMPRVEEPHAVALRVAEFPGVTGRLERKALLDGLAHDEARERFDLARAPLIRARLIRYSPAEHALLLTTHHIALDGLSLRIVIDELAALYEALGNGKPASLLELPVEYRDFAAWQHARLQGERHAEQVAFWKQELAGELPILDLPLDRARLSARSFRGAREQLRIASGTRDALEVVARRHDATLFMILLASYDVLLHRYTGQRELLVGSPTAGRVHGDTAGLVGCFINELVIRATVDPRARFCDLLDQLRDTTQRVMAHQELPFESLVSALAIPRDRQQNAVFQTLFGLQDIDPARSAAGVVFDVVLHGSGTARFDLELTLFKDSSGLLACIDYDTDVLDPSTVARMLRHYVRILEQVAHDDDVQIDRISLLDEAELRQIVVDWNATTTSYPEGRCVHELFAEQAARTPGNTAVVFEGTQLTYQELDQRSNQLAHHLSDAGVSRGDLVGLYLERSLELIVGLLGVLKSGAAYVPLDPSHPQDRVAFMLDETRVGVVLSQRRFDGRIPAKREIRVIHLDDWDEITRNSTAPPASDAGPEDPMYVMYTSGSTGQPKGVLLEHRAVTNRVVAMQRAYVTERDVVLHKTAYTFDVAVGEIFVPLIAGAQLVIARPDGHRDPAYLKQIIQQRGITVAEFVPSMLDVFVRQPGISEACRSLRLVVASGEALSRELQDRYFEELSGELHNVYGPTEAGEVTAWPCQRASLSSSPAAVVPIGRPMANVQIYILDASGQPVPIGVRGELFIGGVCLARGYFRRPDLTAERFCSACFGAAPIRLYRTGDLARFRADGVIEFCGRADSQVKLRGFRVELGEIESVLRQQPEVNEAVVVVREERPGDQRLVAYVVMQDARANTDDLRAALKDKLPDHMNPSAFVVLEQFPLTVNGKIDRKALPAPAARPDNAAEALMSETERKLTAIWTDALGIGEFGALDDFFALGGNSLLILEVASRIAQEFGLELPQQELFDISTVRQMAARIDEMLQEARDLLGSIPPTDDKVEHAQAILADPLASPAAKLGAKAFLETLRHGR